MTRHRQRLLIVGGVLLVTAVIIGPVMLSWLANTLGGGAARQHTVPLAPGPGAIPPANPAECPASSLPSPTPLGKIVLNQWAEKDLTDWSRTAKVTAPRIMLAKLFTNTDVAAVNNDLLNAAPNAGSGSTWQIGPLGRRGDYDFTEVTLTTILYLFGNDPDRLYPETVQHMLDVLLVEEGGTPRVKVPGSLGLVEDTENHHLMTEGSRYLKNQWLYRHGSSGPPHNNLSNGLEQWLYDYLQIMQQEGIYEFNSDPYAGYTIQALLNLEAFAESERLKNLARHILDEMNWQYALGSSSLRRFPPFRRQVRRAHITSLIHDPHTQYMRVWTRPPENARHDQLTSQANHQAVIAAALPYRPPPAVIEWTKTKKHEYLALFGRGPGASPEIYSGGPSYLLSAGGVHRGKRSMIVARPIVLLLSDEVTDVKDCFRLPGQGNWRDWNSTGVHARFACSNAPVVVPDQFSPVAADGPWAIYSPTSEDDLLVLTYSRPRLGLLIVVPNPQTTPAQTLDAMRQRNDDDAALAVRCALPDGAVFEYEPDAPKGTWPISTVNGRALVRDYDNWPRFGGTCPQVSFDRRP